MRLPPAIGILLYRLIVPLWILTGAGFKMLHRTPKNLPPTLLKPAHAMGLDLQQFLWVSERCT